MDNTIPSSAERRAVTEKICDVLVVGGGPAGTTIASLLARKGWNVALLERATHPRFHIGESLLPMNLPILERLGVLDEVRRIGVVKYAAEFGRGDGDDPLRTIYFADALDKRHPHAFQVRRSEFDEILFRNCAAGGVAAFEGVEVEAVDFDPGEAHRVHAVDHAGEATLWRTRFVVDATGRDTFLARKMKMKEKNPGHQSAAIFAHFENVSRRPGKDEGNISIYWFAHGWFWMIPLRDDVTSVGAVCRPEYLKSRRTDAEPFLWETIKLCPRVSERMRAARMSGRARATGNYSYRSRRMHGRGYVLVGDAYAFVDPVFSTGVYLAMNSAELGAEAVDAHLRGGSRLSQPAFRYFERRVRRGIAQVSWFIYRFTSPSMQQLFLAPRNGFRIREAIISLLAGDLFGRTPIGIRLALFKFLYYLASSLEFQRSRASYLRRRRSAAVAFNAETDDAG